MKSDSKRFVPGGLAVAVVLLGVVPLARASAPAGRYTINTDTVIDNVTHLTWQRAVTSTTFTWDGSASPASGSAQYYCNQLSLGGIGPGGWKLPRKLELESIVDFGSCGPAIDATAFPNTPSTYFWSSSPLVSSPGYASYVDFYVGVSRSYDTSSSYSVRCVH